MEIVLDAGKDVISDLEALAIRENEPMDVVALKVLSLGLRVYVSSLDAKESGALDKENDIEMLRNILKTGQINNELLSEILTNTFDRERSRLKVFNSEDAIKVAEQLAERYLQGAEKL